MPTRALVLVLALFAAGASANDFYRLGKFCSGALVAEAQTSQPPDGMCTRYDNDLVSKLEIEPRNASFDSMWDNTPYLQSRIFVFTKVCLDQLLFDNRRTLVNEDLPDFGSTATVYRYVCNCANSTMTMFEDGAPLRSAPLNVCQDLGGSVSTSVIYTCSACGGGGAPAGGSDDSAAPSVLRAPHMLAAAVALALAV